MGTVESRETAPDMRSVLEDVLRACEELHQHRAEFVSSSAETSGDETPSRTCQAVEDPTPVTPRNGVVTGVSETPEDTDAEEEEELSLALAISLSEAEISSSNPQTVAEDTSASAERSAIQYEHLRRELQCPICLEMFNMATTLGCGHTFCAGCLQEAGERCPMCRTDITSVARSVALDNLTRSLAAMAADTQ